MIRPLPEWGAKEFGRARRGWRRWGGRRLGPLTRIDLITARRFQPAAPAARLPTMPTVRGPHPLRGLPPGLPLAGGLGLPARRPGYVVDRVRAIDAVTAGGRLRHATAETDPDLFWASRGGRGGDPAEGERLTAPPRAKA